MSAPQKEASTQTTASERTQWHPRASINTLETHCLGREGKPQQSARDPPPRVSRLSRLTGNQFLRKFHPGTKCPNAPRHTWSTSRRSRLQRTCQVCRGVGVTGCDSNENSPIQRKFKPSPRVTRFIPGPTDWSDLRGALTDPWAHRQEGKTIFEKHKVIYFPTRVETGTFPVEVPSKGPFQPCSSWHSLLTPAPHQGPSRYLG